MSNGTTNDKNPDQELLNIDDEELFRKRFQSFYYMMNAKPDSKTKIFTSDVCIELSDVQDLNCLITEKFKSHYNNAGFLINVSVSFENKKSLFFESWQLFEEQKWIQSQSIDSMLIKWEFNAELPGYQIPQRHTLIVKMSDGIRPEELFKIMFSGGFDDIQEIDKDGYPVVASVDFIDSTLGDELIEIVANWVKGLKTNNDPNTILNKLKKNKRKVALFANYFFTFIFALCCIRIVTCSIDHMVVSRIGDMSKNNCISLIYIIFATVVIFTFVKNVFEAIAKTLFETLRDISSMHTFNITKGDKREREEDERLYKKATKGIFVKIVCSLCFDIICAMLTNIITRVML